MLITIEHRDANGVLDGNDGSIEVAGFPRRCRARLAFDSEGVDVFARVSVLRGDQIGTDALRDEGRAPRKLRVGRPGAPSGAHRDAAHALHAATDDEVDVARLHLGCRDVDGLETRGAEAIQLNTGNAVVVARDHRRHAPDVGALLANWLDATEDHVFDLDAVETATLGQRLEHGLGHA